jgi:LacI family transcriptional regulator
MRNIPRILVTLGTARLADRGLLLGITKYARLNGPWIISSQPPYYVDPQRNSILHKNEDFHGAIVPDTDMFKPLVRKGLPVVVLAARKESRALPRIIGRTALTGKMAAEHLLMCLFKHFAYCGFEDIYWSQERGQAFQEAIERAGFQVDFFEKIPSKRRSEKAKGRNHLTEWLLSLPKPVGLFACNDDRGKQVMEACNLAGISVPSDVAILGADNDPFVCELVYPSLSSIALDFEKAGYDAAHLLHLLMKRTKVDSTDVIIEPLYVVQRQSTDVRATGHPLVAEAQRYIREHSAEPLQVTDVLSALQVSRSYLDKEFCATFGHTVHREIRRARTERVERLLKETNLSVAQIASNLGFAGSDHMARFFRQEKGLTPKAYRKL